VVRRACSAYRLSHDPGGYWLESEFERQHGEEISNADILDSYETFCETRQVAETNRMTPSQVGKFLQRAGFPPAPRRDGKGSRGRAGLKVREKRVSSTEFEDPEEYRVSHIDFEV
jgi:hypothetical protein